LFKKAKSNFSNCSSLVNGIREIGKTNLFTQVLLIGRNPGRFWKAIVGCISHPRMGSCEAPVVKLSTISKVTLFLLPAEIKDRKIIKTRLIIAPKVFRTKQDIFWPRQLCCTNIF
jgi:hypothetical protein